jgi:AcrR family transcriptional regulator
MSGGPVGRGAYTKALIELAFATDYASVTVEAIIAEAGGTREEFNRLFASKQACAVAATEEITARNLGIDRQAYASEERWPDSLRAGAYAMAKYLAEHPKEIRFGMLDMVWAGELTSALRDQFSLNFSHSSMQAERSRPTPTRCPRWRQRALSGR